MNRICIMLAPALLVWPLPAGATTPPSPSRQDTAMTTSVAPHSAAITDRDAQLRLLDSADPRLAANKRLVFDMYREIVMGGHAERVEAYFTPEYIQHNPNVASGRDALAAFLRGSRPARPVEDRITLPLLNIIAEGDYVLVICERPETDEHGQAYRTSWFDFYRIADGRIAEHWDPALKSAAMLRFDPNTKR
ncbi:MAG TPA: nuclear transport factor 2 family protein [Novosphingobium sp.]|nr:nuclear transport factor 2 family protein [Novosphingobium sp.]